MLLKNKRKKAQVDDMEITATDLICSCKYEGNYNIQEGNCVYQVVYNSTGGARESLKSSQRGDNSTEILLPKAIIITKQLNLAPGLDLASRFGLLSLPTGFVYTVGTCGDATCPSSKGNRKI